MAYQRTKNYDGLSFLYLTTGNENNLRQMLKIAELRGDPMSRFQNALFLGDHQERTRLLKDVDQRMFIYIYGKLSDMLTFVISSSCIPDCQIPRPFGRGRENSYSRWQN